MRRWRVYKIKERAMTKETMLTILIALKAEKMRAQEYSQRYPDGGWSNDVMYRIQNAIEEVESKLKENNH